MHYTSNFTYTPQVERALSHWAKGYLFVPPPPKSIDANKDHWFSMANWDYETNEYAKCIKKFNSARWKKIAIATRARCDAWPIDIPDDISDVAGISQMDPRAQAPDSGMSMQCASSGTVIDRYPDL